MQVRCARPSAEHGAGGLALCLVGEFDTAEDFPCVLVSFLYIE